MSDAATIIILIVAVISIAFNIGMALAFFSYRRVTDDIISDMKTEITNSRDRNAVRLDELESQKEVIEKRFVTIAETFLRLTGKPISVLENDLQPIRRVKRSAR